MRLIGVFDVGRVMNEKTARNQMVGGMIWGIGYALSEDAVVDMRTGQFVNPDFGALRPSMFICGDDAGAKREKAHKAPGLLHLLWRLRNEDSRHAVSIGLDLLEGMGKGL